MEGEAIDSIIPGGPAVTVNSTVSTLSSLSLLKPLIVYPAFWLYRVLTFALRPALYLLQLVAWPFISLAKALLSLALLPLYLLAKFQAILTFLLAACLIGAFTGACLYFASSFIYKVLAIGDTDTDFKLPKSKLQSRAVRTVADYRATRKTKKKKGLEMLTPKSPREEKMFREMLATTSDVPGYASGRSDFAAVSTGPLSTQTILEEDSSSSFG